MSLILYNYAMSGSSQKVRLALAEKGLTWEDRFVDLLKGEQHSEVYRQINPKGFVPTLIISDIRLTEVSATLEFIDETFAGTALVPDDALERHRMRCWVKKIDEVVHPANGFLSYVIGGRKSLLRLSMEEREAYINAMPNARDRWLRRVVIEKGMDAKEFGETVRAHETLLDDMEVTLSKNPFLASANVSLADLTVLPYVQRLEHLGIGRMIAPQIRPALAKWLGAMRGRHSFKRAIEDYLPETLGSSTPGTEDTWRCVDEALITQIR